MKRFLLSLALLCVVGAYASIARAELVKSEGYDTSEATSIKVVEPVGGHLFVELARGVHEETLPAIVSLPNRDAYVTIKVVAPDGQAWMGKVEVKAFHQTVLRFTSGGATARAAAAPRFTGFLVNDSNGDSCGGGENVRFLVTANGQTFLSSQLVFPGQQVSTVLPAGTYLIQVLETAGRPLSQRTVRVNREGWRFVTGCIEST